MGSRQGVGGKKKTGFSCDVPVVKVIGYFYRYQLVLPESPPMGTGCEVAVRKINAFLGSSFSAAWKM